MTHDDHQWPSCKECGRDDCVVPRRDSEGEFWYCTMCEAQYEPEEIGLGRPSSHGEAYWMDP